MRTGKLSSARGQLGAVFGKPDHHTGFVLSCSVTVVTRTRPAPVCCTQSSDWGSAEEQRRACRERPSGPVSTGQRVAAQKAGEAERRLSLSVRLRTRLAAPTGADTPSGSQGGDREAGEG